LRISRQRDPSMSFCMFTMPSIRFSPRLTRRATSSTGFTPPPAISLNETPCRRSSSARESLLLMRPLAAMA